VRSYLSTARGHNFRAPGRCGFYLWVPVRNLFNVTLLAQRIVRWFLDFLKKLCTPELRFILRCCWCIELHRERQIVKTNYELEQSWNDEVVTRFGTRLRGLTTLKSQSNRYPSRDSNRRPLEYNPTAFLLHQPARLLPAT
jgi:hypothetical protein